MNPLFENDHPFKSSIEKLESNHADFNAKDPKHDGKVCDYLNEDIDWLEGKLYLYHPDAISKFSLTFFSSKL